MQSNWKLGDIERMA